MLKQEIIYRLLEIGVPYTKSELQKMDKADLKEMLNELTDSSEMFPNGRDYDSEDEDFV